MSAQIDDGYVWTVYTQFRKRDLPLFRFRIERKFPALSGDPWDQDDLRADLYDGIIMASRPGVGLARGRAPTWDEYLDEILNGPDRYMGVLE
mmetsp:Transcript_12783/g.38074  ORF Transcript_12783/g.38074 Transcript_12783/m.38074 type:complete len:92 (+) Transcript_12783:557-832(+)